MDKSEAINSIMRIAHIDVFMFRILTYLSKRQRHAEITDYAQTISYMQKSNHFKRSTDKQNYRDVFKVLENLGICEVFKDKKRLKVRWIYWIFPFIYKTNYLMGIELVEVSNLKRNPNLFKNYRCKGNDPYEALNRQVAKIDQDIKNILKFLQKSSDEYCNKGQLHGTYDER